jgi:outer membrane protein assembly factor BamB
LRFVLSDDRGHNWVAEETATKSEDKSGALTIGGLPPLPSRQTATATATGNGLIGTTHTWSKVTAKATSTRTDFIPWSVERPHYRADYQVSSPLFGSDGKALIGPDVKTLTLRIITETGEMNAVYPHAYLVQSSI